MNVVRKTDTKYDVLIPGLLKTKQQTHQDLHLDCPNPNFEQEYESLIIHLSLCTGGCWLRIGEYMKNNEDKLEQSHKLVHILFGSGCILSETQLHAGYYGHCNSTRFHVILAIVIWSGKQQKLHGNYLKQKWKVKKKHHFFDVYEKIILSKSIGD